MFKKVHFKDDKHRDRIYIFGYCHECDESEINQCNLQNKGCIDCQSFIYHHAVRSSYELPEHLLDQWHAEVVENYPVTTPLLEKTDPVRADRFYLIEV